MYVCMLQFCIDIDQEPVYDRLIESSHFHNYATAYFS